MRRWTASRRPSTQPPSASRAQPPLPAGPGGGVESSGTRQCTAIIRRSPCARVWDFGRGSVELLFLALSSIFASRQEMRRAWQVLAPPRRSNAPDRGPRRHGREGTGRPRQPSDGKALRYRRVRTASRPLAGRRGRFGWAPGSPRTGLPATSPGSGRSSGSTMKWSAVSSSARLSCVCGWTCTESPRKARWIAGGCAPSPTLRSITTGGPQLRSTGTFARWLPAHRSVPPPDLTTDLSPLP